MQELIVKTEKIVHGGQALARADRFVVFVDDALPGETVRARLYKKKKSFAFARAVEVLEPAPERIPSDCPLTGDCGGCTFRHCRYASQLAYKKQILVDALHGLPAAQALVSDVSPSPLTDDYRNKMDFTFGRTLEGELRLGLHRRGSFIHILPAQDCRLQSAASREIVRRTLALAEEMGLPPFHEIKKTDGLRQLTVREGRNTSQRMVELVATRPYPGLPERFLAAMDDLADTVIVSRDTQPRGVPHPTDRRFLKGTGQIEETLNGLRFRIGPDTFFQSNTAQAERLFARLLVWAQKTGPHATAIDLFSGTAPIAMHLARAADRVYGAESWEPSVAAARENIRLNGLGNVEMVVADVNAAPPPTLPDRADLLVVDPPRPGLSPKAVDWILRRSPKTLVYVSCNPSTLSRDLQLILSQAPYAPVAVEPFDMFPHTFHLETLAVLSRG